MKQRNYLFTQSKRYQFKTRELRRGDALAQAEVYLEELSSPNQTRFLINVTVYMPVYETADPIFEYESLLDQWTPDHTAIRKAIAYFDDACGVISEAIFDMTENDERDMITEADGKTDWPSILSGRLRFLFSSVEEINRRQSILRGEATDNG